MKNNINELIKYFDTIKKKKFVISERNEPSGIEYTFEKLIEKKEDNIPLPDFKGIEIKTKLGYTTTSITLFCLTPNKENDSPIKFLLNNYGYPSKNNKEYKDLKFNVACNRAKTIASKYIAKLKLDKEKLILVISDKQFNNVNKEIYWNLKDIKKRLETKLKYLAYIKGYPYKKDNKTYYKYTNLEIYKLKSFNRFIELLEENKIYITFNISMFKNEKRNGQIHDRGTTFKLNINNVEDLFKKIY